MAMVRKLWRLQAIATELDIPVKRLAKQLEDLEPDKTEENARGIDRWYKLARVLDHLRVNEEGPGGKRLDLSAERARLASEQADKTALANAQLRGELVRIETVSAAWSDLMVGIRARMLALPTKLAAELSTINETNTIRDRLTEEIHDVLSEASAFDPGDGSLRSEDVDEERPETAEAPAPINGKRVGRPVSKAKSRKQRRTRTVANR